MNKNYIFLLAATLFLLACGSDSNNQSKGELTEAAGGKYYGGVFKMNETEYFRSLYPHNVTEVGGHRIGNQIYEGLVIFNQADLGVLPALAESWEIDSMAQVYTFKLRKGVVFHDDPCFEGGKGREVKASDVKYCFDRLCSFDVNNKGYDFIKERIMGAPEYYESTKDGNPLPDGCEGIKVLDEYTVQITLQSSFAGFLNILALPFCYVFPKEAVETYGIEMRAKAVGTGPFVMKTVRENDAVILVKNQNYWAKDEDGNQLPYLDGIRWSFIGDQKAELLKFAGGDLDMVYRLPLEMTDEIVDRKGNLLGDYKKFTLQQKASMTIQYYGFRLTGDIYNKKALRQAFNYAIDRDKIVDYTLKGAGVPGVHGVVPPAFKGYNISDVKGYDFQPEKARQLMAEAGHPNGEGLGEQTLQINSGGGRNEQVAEAIQKMLKENLNVDVKITKMPFAQHLEAVETSKSEFWRAGWIADYPDPENFLSLFWSEHIPPKLTDKSYLNTTRYRSAAYDGHYEQSLRTVDDAERNALYLKADQQVMEDAPILMIFYPVDYRLLQPDVRDFQQNSMEYRNLRSTYFVPEKE